MLLLLFWSEDWSTFSDDEKPTKGTNATYVCGGAKTSVKKGDVENYAGGVTPEIMIADKGSLSITINDLKGADNGLMFTFKRIGMNLSSKCLLTCNYSF